MPKEYYYYFNCIIFTILYLELISTLKKIEQNRRKDLQFIVLVAAKPIGWQAALSCGNLKHLSVELKFELC